MRAEKALQRASRAETSGRKAWISVFHWVFERLTGKLVPPDSGNFGLVDARGGRAINLLGGDWGISRKNLPGG